MAYDNPVRQRYDFPEVDASAGDSSFSFKGPSGKTGRIRAAGIEVTTLFANDTTDSKVEVGKSGSLAAYASASIADASAVQTTQESTSAVADIPADTQCIVTFVAGTDSSAVAGKGTPFVEVDWF